MSRDHAAIEIAGEAVTLLAAGALFWPRASTLFIADPHFGKADSFQAVGIPIPGGATDDDLARLADCLAATGARRLIILGDFFHNRASRSPAVLQTLMTWRRAHAALEILLVAGNHDRHAGPPPAELTITTVGEPFMQPPFACCHHPPAYVTFDPQPTGYILAGHEHPCVRLREPGGLCHRFPCFHVGQDSAILPAFGTFTGGHAIQPQPGARIFALVDNAIRPIPLM